MDSSETEQHRGTAIWMRRPRRMIPGRLANYGEPLPKEPNPEVVSNCHQPVYQLRIPGRMANYPGLNTNITMADNPTVCTFSPDRILSRAVSDHETVSCENRIELRTFSEGITNMRHIHS
jgi:hypothetical protein